MAGFVQELTDRPSAIKYTVDTLAFPWSASSELLPLSQAEGRRLASPVFSREPSPPFTRSTRDGFALSSLDCFGASALNPAFLRLKGEVPMGGMPCFSVEPGECALIHTGGALPMGTDAVVMAEFAEESGEWIEIRDSVQREENTVSAGEEYDAGTVLLEKGALLDFRTLGIPACAGVAEVSALRIKAGIISSGDEIVPYDTAFLSSGQIRDVNSHILSSLMRSQGYEPRFYGIAGDDIGSLERLFQLAYDECDVVLVNGGSSVSARDQTSRLFESLSDPGMLVRGILMSPGKPTLIAGARDDRKLVFGLPGHPFSCFLSAYTVALPLMHAIHTGRPRVPQSVIFLTVTEPVYGHSGVEEFLPCSIEDGKALPRPVKSSFSGALRDADGLIRLPASRETVRPGEEVEVWLW